MRRQSVIITAIICNLLLINNNISFSFTCRHPNKYIPSLSKYSISQKTTKSRKRRIGTAIHANQDDTDNDDVEDKKRKLLSSYIDAIIEDDEENNKVKHSDDVNDNSEKNNMMIVSTKTTRKSDTFKSIIQSLATLSLKDYEWRSQLFKNNEADRMMEETLARMRGVESSYVRPMDADERKLGPLGKAEKEAVTWLSNVIEEEGKRAQKIIDEDRLVRPSEAGSGDGPLGQLEKQASTFLQSIADSETERVVSGKIRPMMLEESKRGPLGLAEAKAYKMLQDIATSEQDRMKQSNRMGEVVRPIDIPGPLGEIEKALVDLVSAEKQRFKDRNNNQGKLVRPKDASITSALGQAEQNAVLAIDTLREEEIERLKSIQRYLSEKRPMEKDRESPLGLIEALFVGLFRGPQLLSSVIDRVKELLASEKLPLLPSSSSSNSTLSE